LRRTLLKRDLFGVVCRLDDDDDAAGEHAMTTATGRVLVERDTSEARWWLRTLARRLARREARALQALRHLPGVPRLEAWDGTCLRRTWLEGEPLHRVQPREAAYFREALRLLRRLHAAGVVHNDLAKEPNWLVTPSGRPALIDFQLALHPRYRGRWFRALAYDDLRHLLKHKQTYCPASLTRRQHRLLARRSWPGRLWMRAGKPVYRLVTRRMLGWADREGAGDRSVR
jgi:hypothetical protein